MIVITRELNCDADKLISAECWETFEGFPGESAAIVRRNAARRGWTRRDGYDRCPKHKLA